MPIYKSLLLLAAILVTSCSERQRLKTGMEYVHSGSELPFSSTVYVFSDETVSVFMEIGKGEDICTRKRDGEIITSTTGTSSFFNNLRGVGAAKGVTLSRNDHDEDALVVIFGPGDRMPVLESAPYKIQGTSVYVDWSQNHSKYFAVSHRSSDPEVFTIKNEGLVLESATRPGYTLTMGGRAASSLSYSEKVAAESRQESRRATQEKEKAKERLRQLQR